MCVVVWRQCRKHCWRELQRLLPNPNVLVAISKGMWAIKLHQQNPPILNWRCRLTQVDLYNGHKMVVVVLCKNAIHTWTSHWRDKSPTIKSPCWQKWSTLQINDTDFHSWDFSNLTSLPVSWPSLSATWLNCRCLDQLRSWLVSNLTFCCFVSWPVGDLACWQLDLLPLQWWHWHCFALF